MPGIKVIVFDMGHYNLITLTIKKMEAQWSHNNIILSYLLK